jgi:hypothetical protein
LGLCGSFALAELTSEPPDPRSCCSSACAAAQRGNV